MKVLSVSEMYGVFSSYDHELMKTLLGEEILLVNKRSGMIVGKVKVMKPPKKHRHIETYYLPKPEKK